MILTNELLFDYQRCKRRSFLNAYGDLREVDPKTELALKIQQDSQTHRENILAEMNVEKLPYSRGNWAASARATLDLMRQGVECIANGVLLVEGTSSLPVESSQDAALLSRPDLLVKQAGKSIFGNWVYIPVDIRFSKRPKRDYQIMAAFHSLVLAEIQGVRPEVAWLILREKGKYTVDLAALMPLMSSIAAECFHTLDKQIEPELFISRHPCEMCRWFSSCHAIAKSTRHISLLPGVTSKRYEMLLKLNLTTVEALANVNPAELAIHLLDNCRGEPDVAAEVAATLKLQAQAVAYNMAIPLPAPLDFAAANLPTYPVELYFDIEAQPEMDLAFLHGVLVVDRTARRQIFYPFLAERPEDEGIAWAQFLQLVERYPQAPIFHFCEYEAQTVKKLGRRYGTPSSQWRSLLYRFVDLHKWATKTVVMPVESYSLKTLARWLGFEWRNKKANGAQCILWYNQWLENPEDRQHLDSILLYNEDDCRATYILKEWLSGFLNQVYRNHERLSS
ncbi:MAG: TM0106 family RecB-like putative nuclease [Oscillatoria sp. SIO1A7]|nr:TM0106 family RecB-like putative nuclease [Oscillatoria sp. SIO1A7]